MLRKNLQQNTAVRMVTQQTAVRGYEY